MSEPLENYDASGWSQELAGLFSQVMEVDISSAGVYSTLTARQCSGGDTISHAANPEKKLSIAFDMIKGLCDSATVIVDELKKEHAGTPDICDLYHGPEMHLMEIYERWGQLRFV